MFWSTAFADMRIYGELRRSRDPWFGWSGEPLNSDFKGGREDDVSNSVQFLQSWMVGLSGRNTIGSRARGDSFPSGGVLVLDLKRSKRFHFLP